MADATRSLTELFGIFGARRSTDASTREVSEPAPSEEPQHATKALAKFLKYLQVRDGPALIDLGPVVGSNLTFFGEQLGCRIRVEDLFEDLERHAKRGKLDELPAFLEKRFPQPSESIDGILCWDVFDFLDRPSAQSLATALTRLLRPDGALLGLFNTGETRAQVYTKYIVVNESYLRYRTYPSARPRQRTLLNRDIIRLFEGLRVTDSFLMKNNVREILFRKPAYLSLGH
jgi:hypothetical protein